jgi:hypothetical protein
VKTLALITNVSAAPRLSSSPFVLFVSFLHRSWTADLVAMAPNFTKAKGYGRDRPNIQPPVPLNTHLGDVEAGTFMSHSQETTPPNPSGSRGGDSVAMDEYQT